jgi:hypothetical protein
MEPNNNTSSNNSNRNAAHEYFTLEMSIRDT